jgi:hypothetical protein
MSDTAFSSWPINGSPPAVSFYYNYNWVRKTVLNSGTINTNFYVVPIVANPTDPLSKSIGQIECNEVQTEDVYNDIVNITFKDGSSISFNDNKFATESKWGSNSELIFRIIDGHGIYLVSQGYIVVNTDSTDGRYVKVYTGVIKYL